MTDGVLTEHDMLRALDRALDRRDDPDEMIVPLHLLIWEELTGRPCSFRLAMEGKGYMDGAVLWRVAQA